MLHLDKKHEIMIRDILTRIAPYDTVWVYGSRIKGKSHEGSDLDLVLISSDEEDIIFQKIAALREAFSESNLPILVDIMDWNTLPREFKQEIEKEYEVFQ